MDDFSNKITAKSFALEVYLGETIKRLNRVKEQTKMEWLLDKVKMTTAYFII